MANDSEDEVPMYQKLLEICTAAIDRCHSHLLKGKEPMSITELRNLMFVIRESWFLVNDDTLAQTMGSEKYNAMSDEDEDNFRFTGDDDEEDEEDEEPPHPLK